MIGLRISIETQLKIRVEIGKQFLPVGGKPVLMRTMEAFRAYDEALEMIVVLPAEQQAYWQELCHNHAFAIPHRVADGGKTRFHSVRNGLDLVDDDGLVGVHDGVRPFITYDVIVNNIEGVEQYGNAITCTPCFETILISRDGEKVGSVPFRKETYSAQAPQSFYLQDILSANEKVREMPTRYENLVDSCTLIRVLGQTAHMVPGNRGNIKVTTPEDVYVFRALLTYRENEQAFGLGLTDHLEARLNRRNR